MLTNQMSAPFRGDKVSSFRPYATQGGEAGGESNLPPYMAVNMMGRDCPTGSSIPSPISYQGSELDNPRSSTVGSGCMKARPISEQLKSLRQQVAILSADNKLLQSKNIELNQNLSELRSRICNDGNQEESVNGSMKDKFDSETKRNCPMMISPETILTTLHTSKNAFSKDASEMRLVEQFALWLVKHKNELNTEEGAEPHRVPYATQEEINNVLNEISAEAQMVAAKIKTHSEKVRKEQNEHHENVLTSLQKLSNEIVSNDNSSFQLAPQIDSKLSALTERVKELETHLCSFPTSLPSWSPDEELTIFDNKSSDILEFDIPEGKKDSISSINNGINSLLQSSGENLSIDEFVPKRATKSSSTKNHEFTADESNNRLDHFSVCSEKCRTSDLREPDEVILPSLVREDIIIPDQTSKTEGPGNIRNVLDGSARVITSDTPADLFGEPELNDNITQYFNKPIFSNEIDISARSNLDLVPPDLTEQKFQRQVVNNNSNNNRKLSNNSSMMPTVSLPRRTNMTPFTINMEPPVKPVEQSGNFLVGESRKRSSETESRQLQDLFA